VFQVRLNVFINCIFLVVFLKKFISAASLLDLSCSFSVQVSLLNSIVGVSNALYIRGLV
jgi:hypothetical protein